MTGPAAHGAKPLGLLKPLVLVLVCALVTAGSPVVAPPASAAATSLPLKHDITARGFDEDLHFLLMEMRGPSCTSRR